MKYKVRKGIKINSEEGDTTPENSEVLVLGELLVPQEVRNEAIENGIRDTEKMYLTYLKDEYRPHFCLFIACWKVEISNEELHEIAVEEDIVEILQETMNKLENVGFVSYSK